MSTLPPYPAYKDSSLPWLVSIPTGWSIDKLSRVLEMTVGWTPPTSSAESFEGNNLWANISDLGSRIVSDTAKRISDAAVARSRMKVSPRGSLLYSFKLSVGRVSFAGVDMYTNEAIATFVPSTRLDIRYAYYALPEYLSQNATENIYGAKILNQERILATRLALPDPTDQRQIASYLDRETAEIDAFIADQEELIGLLTERRAATISHAVTKGLNPSAPMKDSGSSALGDIPSHWKPAAMRRVVSEFVQGLSPQAEGGLADAHSIGVLRAGCVNGGTFNELDHKRLSSGFNFDDSIRVRIGDIIVNRASGSPKLVGSAARVRSLSYNLILSDKTFRLSPAPLLTPDFLELFLNSAPYRTQVLGSISGAEGLANNLPMSALKSMTIPLPPLTEQVEIAEYLQGETAELDAAMSDAREAIALSRERRAALISAAVTGKIDVRGAA